MNEYTCAVSGGAARGVRSASVRHAGGYLCSGFHELHFHGSFNTFPHPLLGICQWKLLLAVAVGSDPYTTWDLCN